MEQPGLSEALHDPELMDAADEKAQKLLDELKKEAKVEIKDIGTLRKELRVTVPEKVIADHVDHNYEELRHDAMVPGFRKGHAPRRLIEKRFGSDVRSSLKTAIVGQSYFAALENNELEVLGDPLFSIQTDDEVKLMEIGEALQHFELPESGDFTYTCEIEIKPTFELPELKGIKIKTPVVEITDAQIDEQLERQRKLRGRLEPVSEPAQADDVLVADIALTVAGEQVKSEENTQVAVRATRLDSVPLEKLGEELAGVEIGQSRTVDCTLPDDYERADLRGKAGQFKFTVHEIKRLRPAEVQQIVEQFGCDSEAQLRGFIRDDLEAEKEETLQREKRTQVYDYLLDKCKLELPEKLSARQTDRAVVRRVLELRQAGIPESDIEAHIDELRTSAREQVARDLRLSFILEKVAEQLGVDVTDEEVNTDIAQMARRYNRRFDRIRDDLQKAGMLSQLAEQIRQNKCVAQLLEDADITGEEADK